MSPLEDVMYKNNISKKTNLERIVVVCDVCAKEYTIRLASAKNSLKAHGHHQCASCSAKLRKPLPQCDKSFWTEDQREKHSRAIKGSKKYYSAIKDRDMSGDKNGMFGKKHSAEARKKMSMGRTWGTGENAYAWKGGVTSINSRVKGLLHTRLNWYSRVYARDGWKCRLCDSKTRIDAHHIKPISTIIKALINDTTFETESEKVEYLIEQDSIADNNLKNGITLCRSCHKKIHTNWGSHNPEVLKGLVNG